MATLLHADTPTGPGLITSPLLMVSGAFHVFRALEHLRMAAIAQTPAQPSANLEEATSGPQQHYTHQQSPSGLSAPRGRHDWFTSSAPGAWFPKAASSTWPSPIILRGPDSVNGSIGTRLDTDDAASADIGLNEARWSAGPHRQGALIRENEDAGRGFSGATTPAGLGLNAVAAEGDCRLPAGGGPALSYATEYGWEQLAALYAASLTAVYAVRSPSSSSSMLSISAAAVADTSPGFGPIPAFSAALEMRMPAAVIPGAAAAAAPLWRPGGRRSALKAPLPPGLHPHHHHPHPHLHNRCTTLHRHCPGGHLQTEANAGVRRPPDDLTSAPLGSEGPGKQQQQMMMRLMLQPHLHAPRVLRGSDGGGARAAGAAGRGLEDCGFGAAGIRQAQGEVGESDRAAAAAAVPPLAVVRQKRTEVGKPPPPQWLQAATTLAGAVSRTAAQMAIHPLDTLKTRMQVRLRTPQLQVWRAVMTTAATRPRALAAWAGAAGARDLLLGLGAAVAGVLPASALYFAAEPWFRSRLERTLGADRDSPVCRLAASAAAASLSALIRVPADVVKHRVQAYAYPSSTRAAYTILATQGPAGLYAGFGATLLRDAPELVIQFTVYRQLKVLLEQRRRRGDGGGSAAAASEHLILGGAAGAAAALATTPLDVIKTQLQCGAAASVPAAAAHVLRTGGSAALFSGLAPRLLQTSICSALFFTCFEASKARLNDLAAVTAAAAPPSTAVAMPSPMVPAVAAACKLSLLAPQGWASPLLPPQRGPGRRRSRNGSGSDGGGAVIAAVAAAAAAPCSSWACGLLAAWGGTLTPVALYAYAYAGAAAPVAAATSASASAIAAAAAMRAPDPQALELQSA